MKSQAAKGLTRTLRDPDRALPAPADPVTAIRARARRQRRTTALATAAVALVVAAALVVPATVTRLTRPLPVATDPPPASSGPLPWAARGPLAGDADLVEDAAGVWRDAGGPADARLLWAGPVDAGRVVVLQGTGGDGRAAIAEVGDPDGRLVLLRTEPIREPDAQLARLVDPRPGAGRTLLLPRPGAVQVLVLASTAPALPPEPVPVPAGGLVTVDRDLEGQPVALLDRDGRVAGDGAVPPTGSLLSFRSDVRLTAPAWEATGGARLPNANDYLGGSVLAGRLPTSPLQVPVSVAVLDDSTIVNLSPSGAARPTFYELHQAGRTYLGSIVWVNERPECVHVDDVTGRARPDALVLRCPLPGSGEGLVAVLLHEGIRMTGLRLEAAGPGQRTVDRAYPTPVEGSEISVIDAGYPTGRGRVILVDDGRQVRPPVSLPPYRP